MDIASPAYLKHICLLGISANVFLFLLEWHHDSFQFCFPATLSGYMKALLFYTFMADKRWISEEEAKVQGAQEQKSNNRRNKEKEAAAETNQKGRQRKEGQELWVNSER